MIAEVGSGREADLGDVRERLLGVERELNGLFFEREGVIRGLLVALLSRQHVLLLGPPGTAKSELLRELCRRVVDSRYFGKLLTRFSTPEEVLGPPDFSFVEGGPYRRVTERMLPTAHVAFLDETFKANSSILNALLSILNERVFEDGGEEIPVPLETLVGASNELPEGETREDLEAFYDRLLLRYRVDYIQDAENFEAMLAREDGSAPAPGEKTTITLEELAAAQSAVRAVDISPVRGQVRGLWEGLLADGIRLSDRRHRHAYGLLGASAWLAGRERASEEDLEVLSACFWTETDQIPAVAERVVRVAHPFKREAEDLLDEAEDLLLGVLEAAAERDRIEAAKEEASGDIERRAALERELGEAGPRTVRLVQGASTQLRAKTERLLELRSEAEATRRSTGRIDEVLARVGDIKGEVSGCIGL